MSRQWISPEKLEELGIDVDHLTKMASELAGSATSELPNALETGAKFIKMARENKQVG